jgi:hypothetical protein
MKRKPGQRRRLTEAMRLALWQYVLEYKHRGIRGTWWDLAEAIEVALREIDDHRRRRLRPRRKG